jgi:SAM-dependent methyltransferase
VEAFRHRTEAAAARETTVSTLRALEALSTGGSVLDVGVGGGAASLPLAAQARTIVGVDASRNMLEEFAEAASARGVQAVPIEGTWPEVGARAEPADVVVCHHVLYNVQDLAPFAEALTEHAARRVVVEITDRHPWVWMNDLWMTFHGLDRPEGPTATDALAALLEAGTEARLEEWEAPPTPGGFERREDAVALVRRRLCLPSERDPEVEEALGDRLARRAGLWSAGPSDHRLATIWWDGVAQS